MVEVLVVISPDCHLCEDALEALGHFAAEYELSIRETPMMSAEGQEILERFRPPLPPFVVVDGELFSAGRLPRRKLRKYLDRARVAV